MNLNGFSGNATCNWGPIWQSAESNQISGLSSYQCQWSHASTNQAGENPEVITRFVVTTGSWGSHDICDQMRTKFSLMCVWFITSPWIAHFFLACAKKAVLLVCQWTENSSNKREFSQGFLKDFQDIHKSKELQLDRYTQLPHSGKSENMKAKRPQRHSDTCEDEIQDSAEQCCTPDICC